MLILPILSLILKGSLTTRFPHQTPSTGTTEVMKLGETLQASETSSGRELAKFLTTHILFGEQVELGHTTLLKALLGIAGI